MAGLDRRLSVRELLEKAFGHIPRFRSKDELIDDESQKFLLDQKPEQADRIAQMRYYARPISRTQASGRPSTTATSPTSTSIRLSG